MSTIKVKFKSKRFSELTSIKFTANCPPLSLQFYPTKRKDIVNVKIPCSNPDSLILTVIGLNKSGKSDTLKAPLNSFRSRYTKTNCRVTSFKVKRRILGIFPLYERSIYRKYLID